MIDLEWFLHLMTCLQSPDNTTPGRKPNDRAEEREPLAA